MMMFLFKVNTISGNVKPVETDIGLYAKLEKMFGDDVDFELVETNEDSGVARKCDCSIVSLISVGCKCGGS